MASCSMVSGATDQLSCLPLERWGQYAGAINWRSNGGVFGILQGATNISTNLQSALVSMGNTIWSLASQLTGAAVSLEHSDAFTNFAKNLDRILGRLGDAFLNGMMVPALIMCVAFVSGLWAVYRNAGARELTKRLVAGTLGISLFIAGSLAAAQDADAASPKTLSPWWLADRATSLMDTASGGWLNGVVDATASSANPFTASVEDANADNVLSCQRYVAELHAEASATAADQANDPYRNVVSRMWERSGLTMWIQSQYGVTGNDNTYTAFCRVLEYRAGATPGEQRDITAAATKGQTSAPLDVGAIAFNPGVMYSAQYDDEAKLDGGNDAGVSSSIIEDRISMLWETCRLPLSKGGGDGRFLISDRNPGWDRIDRIQGDNRGVLGSDTSVNESCAVAVTPTASNSEIDAARKSLGSGGILSSIIGKGDDAAAKATLTVPSGGLQTADDGKSLLKYGFNYAIAKFDVGGTQSSVFNDTGDTNAQNAAKTVDYLHGNASMADVGGSIVFIASSIVNLAIWGGLSILRIIAKFMCAMAAFGLYFALLYWAAAPDKGRRALTQSAKTVGGMALANTVITFVGALILTLTCAFIDLFDGSSPAWVGLISLISPLLSIWMLKWLCVKVLQVGDPFSRQGLSKLMGGRIVGRSAMGAMAGMAAGFAGGMAGGGLMAALSGAASGATMGRAGAGGVVRAAQGGYRSGAIQSHRKKEEDFWADRAGRPAGGASQAAVGAHKPGEPPVGEPPEGMHTPGYGEDRANGPAQAVSDTENTPKPGSAAARAQNVETVEREFGDLDEAARKGRNAVDAAAGKVDEAKQEWEDAFDNLSAHRADGGIATDKLGRAIDTDGKLVSDGHGGYFTADGETWDKDAAAMLADRAAHDDNGVVATDDMGRAVDQDGNPIQNSRGGYYAANGSTWVDPATADDPEEARRHGAVNAATADEPMYGADGKPVVDQDGNAMAMNGTPWFGSDGNPVKFNDLQSGEVSMNSPDRNATARENASTALDNLRDAEQTLATQTGRLDRVNQANADRKLDESFARDGKGNIRVDTFGRAMEMGADGKPVAMVRDVPKLDARGNQVVRDGIPQTRKVRFDAQGDAIPTTGTRVADAINRAKTRANTITDHAVNAMNKFDNMTAREKTAHITQATTRLSDTGERLLAGRTTRRLATVAGVGAVALAGAAAAPVVAGALGVAVAGKIAKGDVKRRETRMVRKARTIRQAQNRQTQLDAARTTIDTVRKQRK